MFGLRLAVATEDFGRNLRQSISLAARSRVRGLRLNVRKEVRAEEFTATGLRQLRHFVEEHQLKVAGLYFQTRHALADREMLEQRLDGLRAAIELARPLGTEEILVRIGRVPDPDGRESREGSQPTNNDVDSLTNPFSFAPTGPGAGNGQVCEAKQFRHLCEVLQDMAAIAGHQGASLQLIPASYDTARLRRLFSEVSTGPVGLVFDPATCVMSGRNPIDVFRDLYSHVGYVRLRDACRDVDGGGVEVVHGDGSVDWSEVMAVLTEAESSLWMCAERTGGDQRGTDAAHAVNRINELLPAF